MANSDSAVAEIRLILSLQTTSYPTGLGLNYTDVRNDNSTNVTSNASQHINQSLAQAEVTVQAVILALAVFGNTCVLIALARRRKINSRMHMFIMHLSIADLLVAFFNILPQLIWDVAQKFQGGDVLCRFVKFMQVFVMYLSTYVLVMTAIDRYRAICHPLSNHNWTTKTVNLMIAGAYCIAGVFSIPQALLFKYQERVVGTGEYDCWVHWDPPWILQLYITSFTFLVYVIPFLILVFAYGSICYTIWSKYRVTREPLVKREVTNGAVGHVMYTLSNQSPGRTFGIRNAGMHPRSHSSRGFSRAKLKTVKLTFVVILAYLVCWSPFFISQLWWLYDESAPMSNNSIVIMLLLASLNSCCNPWIYLAFSGNLIKYLSPCYKSSCMSDQRNQTYTNSNTDNSLKNRSTIELEKMGTREKFKRMGSLTSLLTSRISRKETIITTTLKRPQAPVQDESPKSPHVTKRARVHERPANEIVEAQMKWDRNMGMECTRSPILVLADELPNGSPLSEDDTIETLGTSF
ncbi:cephalotocin receptor 2-like [Haliotis cracherodii]|uniref:cephalotocin receptor 2-like n=1 Tax=Haliotis cracherodii TaxID=6455 RepID=UPI0039E9A5E4